MRLAEFILHNMEAILAQWEAFATTLRPGADKMTPLALRDHAQQILEAIVVGPGGKQILVEDADGNLIELFEPAEK